MAPPLADALRHATPEARDAVRQTAAGILAAYAAGDALVVPGRALVATGRADPAGG